jgi:poly-gamma-glutamate capsule biosynthesis protein CapA/YwtB (metallophosphatase superfamily)
VARPEPARPDEPPPAGPWGSRTTYGTAAHRRGLVAVTAVLALAVVSAVVFAFGPRPSLSVGRNVSGSPARIAAAAKTASKCTTAIALAFAGDVNTANSASRVLDHGLGGAGRLLAHADVAMVNTETVLADDRTGLVRQPKAYNFVAPTRLLDVLHRAGVDVATVANNHGEDYGRLGLNRTLAARSSARPRLIGAGTDVTAAFAPARVTVRGRDAVFFAATDVIDDGLSWSATPTSPGLASIKSVAGLARLRAAVRHDRAAHPCDVISVYLHAGVELNVCPTVRQRLVARDLAADGADVVLMSHAHVLQPGAALGRTAVAYGLGNFVFAGHSGPTSQTGVLTVDIPEAGTPKPTWHPARIVDGLPTMLTGAGARTADQQWRTLGHGC